MNLKSNIGIVGTSATSEIGVLVDEILLLLGDGIGGGANDGRLRWFLLPLFF